MDSWHSFVVMCMNCHACSCMYGNNKQINWMFTLKHQSNQPSLYVFVSCSNDMSNIFCFNMLTFPYKGIKDCFCFTTLACSLYIMFMHWLYVILIGYNVTGNYCCCSFHICQNGAVTLHALLKINSIQIGF